jgi:hypothetical protein
MGNSLSVGVDCDRRRRRKLDDHGGQAEATLNPPGRRGRAVEGSAQTGVQLGSEASITAHRGPSAFTPAAAMTLRPTSASTSATRVEWELLPSLLNLLGSRRATSQPAWMETVPSEFELVEPSGPFEEVLPGLAMREVREPEIFHIFFG